MKLMMTKKVQLIEILVRSNTVRSLAIQLQDYARILRELEKLHYDTLQGKSKNLQEKDTLTTEQEKVLHMSSSKVLSNFK